MPADLSVARFNVGDRVRVVARSDDKRGWNGAEGIVSGVYRGEEWLFHFITTDESECDFGADDLALVARARYLDDDDVKALEWAHSMLGNDRELLYGTDRTQLDRIADMIDHAKGEAL
jgi:hypothetical protein